MSEKDQILAYILMLERSEEVGRLGTHRHSEQWIKSVARESALYALRDSIATGRHLNMPKTVADEHAPTRRIEVMIVEQITPAPPRET